MTETTRTSIAAQEAPITKPSRDGAQTQADAGTNEKRSKRGRKPAAERAGATLRVRYFLVAKDPSRENEKLVLGEELENEDKALVHSLVEGVPFLRVETWIAMPQKRGNAMVIEKRPQP